jgi:hypothetical protein
MRTLAASLDSEVCIQLIGTSAHDVPNGTHLPRVLTVTVPSGTDERVHNPAFSSELMPHMGNGSSRRNSYGSPTPQYAVKILW